MAKKKRRFTPRNSPWQPTDEQLWCRDVQHSWAPHTAKRDGTEFIRTLICTCCGALKEQHLDSEGYVMRSSMIYPAGFLRQGEGRLTRDERAALRLRNL